MTTETTHLFALWMSGNLDWLSLACLKSAINHGHKVDVFSYDEIPNLPKGLHHRDAREVIPEKEIFCYDGVEQTGLIGSYGPFSDAFRYRAMQQKRGIWMDTDVYFLRQLNVVQETLLAWEHPVDTADTKSWMSNLVGSALMRLPANSRAIRDLVNLTSPPYRMPPWVGKPLREKALKKLAGRPFFPGALTYATVGPVALTYYVKKHRMHSNVRSNESYYPVFFNNVRRFGEQDKRFRASLSSATEAIHLWNSVFQRAFPNELPKGSFAARLREESLNA